MNSQQRKLKVDEPFSCRIRAVGAVSEAAVACWDSLQVTTAPAEDGATESLVRGSLPDQSALIGVVNHLYNLGIVILSVECAPVARCASATRW